MHHPVVHRVLLQAAKAVAATSVGWEGWVVIVTIVMGLFVMAFDWVRWEIPLRCRSTPRYRSVPTLFWPYVERFT